MPSRWARYDWNQLWRVFKENDARMSRLPCEAQLIVGVDFAGTIKDHITFTDYAEDHVTIDGPAFERFLESCHPDGIALWHPHPQGLPLPSLADIDTTDQDASLISSSSSGKPNSPTPNARPSNAS
jgi:proteasome lid subunit RPN8/RPN11